MSVYDALKLIQLRGTIMNDVWDRPSPRWEVTNPTGKIFKVHSLKLYCKLNAVSYAMMMRKFRENSEYKGFTVKNLR